MLTITKPSENRLNITLSGGVGAEAMRDGLDTLIDAASNMTNGRILYRISDFEMPSLGALAVELMQMPKLVGLIGRFEKCAVMSDAAWIRTAAEVEGAVIPSLDIRSFPLAATEAAEDWLADEDIDDDDDENFPV